MTVDLDNPAHVEALRQACKAILEGRSVRSGRAKFGRIEAITLFLDAALTADLLRRLLERCGVECVVDTADDWITMAGPPRLHFVAIETTIDGDVWRFELTQRDAVGRMLALLDAPDRAAALAALKGGR